MLLFFYAVKLQELSVSILQVNSKSLYGTLLNVNAIYESFNTDRIENQITYDHVENPEKNSEACLFALTLLLMPIKKFKNHSVLVFFLCEKKIDKETKV